jgi:hypothetical protein
MPKTTRCSIEVADILRAHGSQYRERHPLSPEQATVLRHLVECRTAALGGHVDVCSQCGHQARQSYNSCRDRHCPKCQATKRAAWLEQRLERLLPVPHFHVVFTLPDALYPLALKNQQLLYELLFRTASQTLLALAADARRLGAQIGFTAILHTWGQKLTFHPHLHCVVTAGGLSPDRQKWIHGNPDYLFPVEVMGRLFRGKFLAGLQQLYSSGKLTLAGSTEDLAEPRAFRRLIGNLYRQKWIVYAKPPFAGPEHVFRYLGRYTHRVAISNERLVSLTGGQVRFRYRDYADHNRSKELELTAEEFIRRFLLHVLPKGFVRIRHYGLFASINVPTRLARCRELLNVVPKASPTAKKTWVDRLREWFGDDILRCPKCGGPLERQPILDAILAVPSATIVAPVAVNDTS